MDKYVLVIDCDGVIVDSNPLFDANLSAINYCCSDAYVESVTRQHYERENMLLYKYFRNDQELYYKYSEEEKKRFNQLLKINHIVKDEVLEELFPIYKDRINYFDIYKAANFFKGVKEVIRYYARSGKFEKVYIATQFNALMEILAKYLLFKEEIPEVEVVFIPFHDKETTPYIYDKNRYFENGNRKPTNKIKYFSELTGVHPSRMVVIDDTRRVLIEADEEHVKKTIFRDKSCDDPLKPFAELSEFMLGKTDEEAYQELMKDEKVLRLLGD